MRASFIFLFFLSTLTSNAQSKDAKTILDTTIEIMKTNAANSKNVDWTVLTTQAYRLAENANGPEDLGNSIRFLFKSLDDFHGSFRYKDSSFYWTKEKVVVNQVYKDEFAKKGNRFITRSFYDIGYLRIPFTPQEITKERAQALQDSLCEILAKKPKGLIFDLRLNGGGTMWPMILGVSNVMEKGVVGSFIFPDGKIKEWILEDENISEGANKICSVKKKCDANPGIPLVVITGPFTASAAEDLIVALKTRPNTIFIGEPTAGAVSVNDGFTISKEAGMNLSVAQLMDKNKVLYKAKIQPDILVKGGDNFENLLEDAKVIRAIEWLNTFKK